MGYHKRIDASPDDTSIDILAALTVIPTALRLPEPASLRWILGPMIFILKRGQHYRGTQVDSEGHPFKKMRQEGSKSGLRSGISQKQAD